MLFVIVCSSQASAIVNSLAASVSRYQPIILRDVLGSLLVSCLLCLSVSPLALTLSLPPSLAHTLSLSLSLPPSLPLSLSPLPLSLGQRDACLPVAICIYIYVSLSISISLSVSVCLSVSFFSFLSFFFFLFFSFVFTFFLTLALQAWAQVVASDAVGTQASQPWAWQAAQAQAAAQQLPGGLEAAALEALLVVVVHLFVPLPRTVLLLLPLLLFWTACLQVLAHYGLAVTMMHCGL